MSDSQQLADSSQPWESIRRSPFLNVYVTEVFWLATLAAETVEQVIDEVGPPERSGSGFIRVDHAVHGRILTALLYAARLRAMICERNRSGNRSQQAVLNGRVATLREMLSGIDIEPVLDASVRNSLEHFDEYIDDTAIDSSQGKIARPSLFPLDMLLSSRSVLDQFDVAGVKPTIRHIRVYFADEHVFHNCGRETNLGRVGEACAAIRDRLARALSEDQQANRGARMLVITDRSFSSEQKQS